MTLHSSIVNGRQAAVLGGQRQPCLVAQRSVVPAGAAQPSGLAAQRRGPHRLTFTSSSRCARVCQAAAAPAVEEAKTDLAEFDVAQTILLQV